MIRLYVALFILSTLGGVGYGAYKYYTWTQATMIILRENNVKLEQATVTLQNTVDSMAADAKKNEELNRNLTTRLQQSQVHLDALRNKFARIDLTLEALTDAENLESRVNNAVTRLIEKIQSETTPPTKPTPDSGLRSDDAGTESNNSD